MPSIIIKEIDETSAGTTAIVNDVAYVPGFSAKKSTVQVTGTTGSETFGIKFIDGKAPNDFVPQLRVYQYNPVATNKFTVTQDDNSTIEVLITSATEDTATGITTCTYKYKVNNGTEKTSTPITKYSNESFYAVVSFDVPPLKSVKEVAYNGDSFLFVESDDDVPSTAEPYARVAIAGDYFYDKGQGDLYFASNAPNAGEEIDVLGTATPSDGAISVGDLKVSSVKNDGTEIAFTQDGTSIAVDSGITDPLTVTGSVISKGGLIGVEDPTTTIGVGGLTVTSVVVSGATLTKGTDYTLGTGDTTPITFTKIFWNYIEPTDTNYSVSYVPENIPTYCATKAQFENLFGAYPYVFESNQEYGDMFSEDATPNSPMFRKGDFDPSYIYAKELICAGIPVYYENVVPRADDGGSLSITASAIYDQMAKDFDALSDPNEYNVKYITSGGYPTFEYGGKDGDGFGLVEAMLKIATQGVVDETGETSNAGRGDIVALIDHTNNPRRPLTGQGSVFAVLGGCGTDISPISYQGGTAMYKWYDGDTTKGSVDASYGAMFTPWFKYTTKYTDGYKDGRNIGKFVIKMPASFAYLMDLASSIKTNPSWMAIAGVNRAQVVNYTGRTTAEVLTAKTAQNFQLRKDTTSINPITEIRPYGQCIWGNRTLKPHIEGLTATNFLNIRNLVCDVKKTVYRAAKRCMFEQDTQVLWINFKSQITPLLDQMTTGQGVKAYKIVRVPTTEKAKFEAKVILYPIYAIEDIEVTVVMRDEEVSVTSNEQ